VVGLILAALDVLHERGLLDSVQVLMGRVRVRVRVRDSVQVLMGRFRVRVRDSVQVLMGRREREGSSREG